MLLIYINNFSDLLSNLKLFTDDSYFFCINHSINTSTNFLKDDFDKISEWLFNGNNPDPKKQAEEVIFIRKLWKIIHPSLISKASRIDIKCQYGISRTP